MKSRTLLWMMTVLGVFLVQSAMTPARADLMKVTESVYAYAGVPEGTPGNAFSANAGIVIGQNDVLVVDTLASAREAERFAADIRKITRKPIRYVVNTHYHFDHAFGNSFFAGRGTLIIGHAKCREALVAAGGDKITEDPARLGLPPDFWEGTRCIAPDISFERGLLLDLGGLTVELIHSGLSSHTAGSIIVHVPSQDVLFSGDILFTDFHPYLGDGDLPGWKRNLDFIRKMNIRYIIPGHGPLSSDKDLEDMKTYLSVFDMKARELCGKEKDIDKLTSAMLEAVPKRTGGAYLVTINLKTRYLTDTGKGQPENK